MKHKILFGTIIFFLLLSIVVQRETIIVPEWELLVVDKMDNPVKNIEIRQIWSYGGNNQEQSFLTDTEGVIIFPERKISQSILFHFIGKLLNYINYLVMPHGGSLGPYSSIFPVSGARSNMLRYSDKIPMEHKLILLDYP